MTVIPDGNPCGCGNAAAWRNTRPRPRLRRMGRMMHFGRGHQYRSGRLQAWRSKGNAARHAVFESMGRALGIALREHDQVFNFPLYLLSGGPLPAWDFFAPAMFSEIQKRSFTFTRDRHAHRESPAGRRCGSFRRGVSALQRGITLKRCMPLNSWLLTSHVLARFRRRHQAVPRALLICTDGRVPSLIAAHEEMRMAKPLWAEQDPEDWWRASQIADSGSAEAAGDRWQVRREASDFPGRCTAWSCSMPRHKVIRPALIWCDQRSQQQVDLINRKSGRRTFYARSRIPVLTGFTLPKLLWVRDNEPELFEQVTAHSPAEGLHPLQADGEFATDVSDASGTAMFDVVHRRWSDEMMRGLGIWIASILPAVPTSPARLLAEVHGAGRAATGLRAGTPVVGGRRRPGRECHRKRHRRAADAMSCTVGTSGVVFAYLEKPAYDPEGRVHTFCHAVPDAWHVMGVTQGAGLSLQWYPQPICARPTTMNSRRKQRSPRRRAGLILAPVSDGRANTSSGCRGPRRMDRTDGQASDGRTWCALFSKVSVTA